MIVPLSFGGEVPPAPDSVDQSTLDDLRRRLRATNRVRLPELPQRFVNGLRAAIALAT
jgi:hypothetical protein